GPVKKMSHNYRAHCPAHDDHHPSLDVAEGSDGRALLTCRSHDCNYEQIMTALGLDNRQAGRGGGAVSGRRRGTVPQAAGLTVADYAAAKQLPVEFLHGLGLTEISYSSAPAVRMPYLDTNGIEAAVRIRRGLVKSEQGDQRFVWKQGSKPRLYGLERLRVAKA